MTAPQYRSLVLDDVTATKTAGYTTLEGRAVPYWQYTDVNGYFLEQFATHALNRSTVDSSDPLPLLLFHDAKRWPIGRSVEWRSESDGLYGMWRLNGTDDAQHAADLAGSGDLRGLSIGFLPEQSVWNYAKHYDPNLGPDYTDKVTRVTARMLEVSLVSTPAFANAGVSSVRSVERSPQSLVEWRVYLDRQRRKVAR